MKSFPKMGSNRKITDSGSKTMRKKCYIAACNQPSYDGNIITKLYCIPRKLSASKTNLKQQQANKLRRKSWLSNLGCQETVSNETYVCQRHFVSGKPSTPSDFTNIDWVPTLLLTRYNILDNTPKQMATVTANKKNEKQCEVRNCITNLKKNNSRMYLIPRLDGKHKKNKLNSTSENTRKRRQMWLESIGCVEPITENSYVCQHHFVTGKPSKTTATTDIDWTPSLLLPTTLHDKTDDNINCQQHTSLLTAKPFRRNDVKNTPLQTGNDGSLLHKTEITKTIRNKTVQAQKVIETIASDDLTVHIQPPKKKKQQKIRQTIDLKKAKQKLTSANISRKRKKKVTSTNTQQQSLTEKCQSQIKKLLPHTKTSSLSLHMPTCPMKEQLKETERDPVTALLSFAVNSGLGRFSDADQLHTVFELMKDPDNDSSVVPEKFKSLVAEIESEIVLSDTERIVLQHNIDVNKSATLTACASCGMRAFDMGTVHHSRIPITQLHILKCTTEQKSVIEKTDEEFRKGIHYTILNDDYYNLNAKFIEYDDINKIYAASLCVSCSDAVTAKRIPMHSLANGVDYGDALAFDLEQLTIPEQYLIALGRVYGTVLKLSGNKDEERQAAFTGHMITFPQPDDILMAEITRINSNITDDIYPRVDDLHAFLSVVFVGARQQWDAFVPTPYSKIPEIQVNPQKVYRYLRVLKALHPAYKNIVIDDSKEMSSKLSDIPSELLQRAEITHGEMENRMDKMVLDDSDNQSDAKHDNVNFPNLPTVFMTHNAPLPTDVDGPSVGILKSMQQAVTHENKEVTTTPFLQVPVEKEPFNEFENNPSLFYASFPHLFLLGRGLLQQSSISKQAMWHLLLQYDCRSSQCLSFIFLLFDQMKRHAAAKTVTARVKTNPDSLSQFANWICDKSFVNKLKTAREHPEDQSSKELLALITKHIALFESKIPFTAGQRHSSMSHLLAMITYLGFPSDFFTFAVDDIYGLLNIRLSLPQMNNHTFPATDSGLTAALKDGTETFQHVPITPGALRTLLAENPVPAAETFRLLVNSVFTNAIGMPPSEHARRTIPLPERGKGFAGTCTGAYGAMEDQKRGSLHMHCVLFGSINSTLLQSAAGIPFMKHCISKALEAKIGTSLNPITHLRHLLNEIKGVPLQRPSLFTPHNPTREPEEFLKDVERTVDSCNVHRHTKSCFQKNHFQCRYARPQTTAENTYWIQLQGTKKTPIHPNVYDVLTNISPPDKDTQDNRDLFAYPIAKSDNRIIIYELKRSRIPRVYCPCCQVSQQTDLIAQDAVYTEHVAVSDIVESQFEYLKLPNDLQSQFEHLTPEMHQRINRHLCHRNGLVVEFNPGMSAILGCNTNFSFLGSESAARCAACYVLKYITKNPAELASTIALVYKARVAVERYPSKAEDSGTQVRTAIHFLNAILNRINGLEEVSSQMASAAVIGMPFDTVTHDFQLTFVTAAMAYAKREKDEKQMETSLLSLEDDFGIPDAENLFEKETINEEENKQEEEGTASWTPEAVFEPFVNEYKKEGETWGQNEGYCSSPIYTGLTGKVACPQHVHYANRHDAFASYSLFEYAGVVKIMNKSDVTLSKKNDKLETETLRIQQTTDSPTNKDTKATAHRGRHPNGSFPFSKQHPLFETHEQQIRSKHFIPIPIGVPPCPPGKRQITMTDAWKHQARKFAKYILILFRPWEEDEGRLPGPLTWKALCKFLHDLRNDADDQIPSILSRIRLAWIGNMSRGLRMNTVNRVAATHYRMRNATVLGKPDGTSSIIQPMNENMQGFNFDFDNAAMESNFGKDRRFQQNDPRTAIEMLRMEAAADDLLQRRNQKELAFHQATLNQLNVIVGHDAAATIQSPMSQYTVHRLLYTKAPENTSFENIISKLSSPMPVQQEETLNSPQCSNETTTGNQTRNTNNTPQDDPKDATVHSMNDGQKAVSTLIDNFLHAEAASRNGLGCKPKPPRLFIDGGPGTGKTYLINCIKQNAEKLGLSVMTCAYTGSAVDNLPKGARTIHSMFGFRVADPHAATDYQMGSTQKKLVDLRKHINLVTVCMLIIDEISYVTSKFLGRIEKRLREIMANKNLPFGGFAVIIVGDMYQFPPVDGTALYTSTADLYLRNKKMDPATTAGVQYFITFRKIILQQQMRFTGDTKHMCLINKLRQDNPPMCEIIAEIGKDYQILSRKLVKCDPLFASNPIIVTSNNERTSINKSQSRTFALKNNTRRFSWQETIFGYNISEMEVTQNEINSLYLHDDSLTRYFVENAPGFITENIKPERGLVNSTAVTYHSLVLDENEDRERIAEQLMSSASNEDIALQYPPKYINVRVDNANPDEFVDMTIIPHEVIIPITVLDKGTPHKGYVSSKPQMVTFSSRSHNVDLQFSKTFHKVQGKTCKRVTVDLNDRPFRPNVSYSSLLVSLSRVKDHLHWCRMPNQPGTTGLDYLKKLKPHADLIKWIHSYDNYGNWKKELCRIPSATPLLLTNAKKRNATTTNKNRKSNKFIQNEHPSPIKMPRLSKN